MISVRLIPYRIGYLLCFTLLLASCNSKKEKDSPGLMPPVKVRVMEVAAGKNESERVYSATVSSQTSTTVSFSVSGTISYLYVAEGQKVSKGQLLGKIESGDYINAKNIAYAQLAEAQDGYDRLKKLHDANALPEVKWVEMEQKLKQAQNAAEMADRTLGDASLYSPASGTISRKFAEPGQTVVPVQPIYEIVSTDNLEADVSVSENQVASFSVGETAIVSFDNKDIPQIEGKVKSKSVVADPLTRSFTVKVALPSSQEGKILPGMIANVTFPDRNLKTDTLTANNIYLPSGCVLLNEDNRWFVWVVEDSTAQRRFVDVDELVANGVRVTSGLKKGDKVIVAGMQKVGTGTRVVTETAND